MNSAIKTLALSVSAAGLVGGTLWVGTSIFGSATAAPESSASTVTESSADAGATSPLNDCPTGTVPLLDIKDNSAASSDTGADTIEDAVEGLLDTSVSRLSLTVTSLAAGSDSAPRWVTAGDETFIVNPAPDGGWLASEATFVECQKLEDALGK